MQNFRTLGAPPPDPQNSPPLRISGYTPGVSDVFDTEFTQNEYITQLVKDLQ